MFQWRGVLRDMINACTYEGKISMLRRSVGESPVLAIGLYLIGAQSFNANLAPCYCLTILYDFLCGVRVRLFFSALVHHHLVWMQRNAQSLYCV